MLEHRKTKSWTSAAEPAGCRPSAEDRPPRNNADVEPSRKNTATRLVANVQSSVWLSGTENPYNHGAASDAGNVAPVGLLFDRTDRYWKGCVVKVLLIAAVTIGAMAGQLAAQSNDPPCGRPSWGHDNFPSWGYACDPYYASYDNYPAPSFTSTTPQVVASPPLAPPPSPPPLRPEVHEYHWPSSGTDTSATSFSIVSKNGRVESAIVVWVLDDTLCYVTLDGGQRWVPIVSIDRRATTRANAEKQLYFWLPADKLENDMAHLQVSEPPA
jgi:hypothetical protein